MPTRLPAGPYRKIQLDDGTEAPYYIIPFDKRGICDGPETRRHLVENARTGGYSDIFIFSHGWNNDWSTATNRYEHFMNGYMRMRRDHRLPPMPPSYKPLLVGLFWPSTALVFTEDERGPQIAAGDPQAVDAMVAEERHAIQELADALSPDDARRFYELTQKDTLDRQEALELARITKTFYREEDEELQTQLAISEQEILTLWASAAETSQDLGDFGTAGGLARGGPQAAGLDDLLQKLDPRNIVRTLTVYQMKDRAGRVGAHGVSALLRDILGACDARIHLIGHSYGGKVVLSAVSFGGELPRPVESVLLLQPAVSHLCFAEKVPGTNHPGGYRAALSRVRKPILTTFSSHDAPLTKFFHLAVRRADDLGEVRIAGEPPSKYAALGGFGPRHAGEQLIDMHNVSQPYELDLGAKVIGLNGSRTIAGHGDISNESTWWALYSLASS